MVSTVMFRSDNELASSSRDGVVFIWDVDKRECISEHCVLCGIDISDLNFTCADLSEKDRDIFHQNGAASKA